MIIVIGDDDDDDNVVMVEISCAGDNDVITLCL